MNACTPYVPGIVAGFLLVAVILLVQAWRVLRALAAANRGAGGHIPPRPVAQHAPQPTLRVRAGTSSSAPTPHPAWTTHHASAIDLDARAAARADFQLGRRRANPHTRHSREAAWWGISYCDEWNDLQEARGSIDTGEEAAQPPAVDSPAVRASR